MKELQKNLENAINHYAYVIDELRVLRDQYKFHEDQTGLRDNKLTSIEISINVLDGIKDAYSEQLIDEYNANDEE